MLKTKQAASFQLQFIWYTRKRLGRDVEAARSSGPMAGYCEQPRWVKRSAGAHRGGAELGAEARDGAEFGGGLDAGARRLLAAGAGRAVAATAQPAPAPPGCARRRCRAARRVPPWPWLSAATRATPPPTTWTTACSTTAASWTRSTWCHTSSCSSSPSPSSSSVSACEAPVPGCASPSALPRSSAPPLPGLALSCPPPPLFLLPRAPHALPYRLCCAIPTVCRACPCRVFSSLAWSPPHSSAGGYEECQEAARAPGCFRERPRTAPQGGTPRLAALAAFLLLRLVKWNRSGVRAGGIHRLGEMAAC